MRIVAGKLRHRIIDMTNLETTRETQDKVRGAIYNMIGPYFDGGACIDVFAGSGAMGIEAFSRGVSRIVLNDLNNDALNVCKKNCKALGINEVKFYNLDYKELCNRLTEKFTLIILDPPYKMDDINEIMESVYPLLDEHGLIVFEMKKESVHPLEFKDLELIKDKPYGIKKVVIYRR